MALPLQKAPYEGSMVMEATRLRGHRAGSHEHNMSTHAG